MLLVAVVQLVFFSVLPHFERHQSPLPSSSILPPQCGWPGPYPSESTGPSTGAAGAKKGSFLLLMKLASLMILRQVPGMMTLPMFWCFFAKPIFIVNARVALLAATGRVIVPQSLELLQLAWRDLTFFAVCQFLSCANIRIVALVRDLCNVCILAKKLQSPILLPCGPRVFEQLEVLACKIHKVCFVAKFHNKPLQFIFVVPFAVVSHVQDD